MSVRFAFRVKQHSGFIRPFTVSQGVITLTLFKCLTGICSQCVVSGNGIYHEEQFSSRRAATNAGGNSKRSNRSKPESREERKQRKYRYLYQVSLNLTAIILSFTQLPFNFSPFFYKKIKIFRNLENFQNHEDLKFTMQRKSRPRP